MKENGIFVQRPSLIIPILVLTVCCYRHPETAIIFEIIHVRKASCYVRVRSFQVKAHFVPRSSFRTSPVRTVSMLCRSASDLKGELYPKNDLFLGKS